MKLNSVLMLASVWAAASAPAFAQGAFVTTVINSAVSPVGHQETNVRFVRSEQTTNNDLSVSTDVQSDSSTTSEQSNGSATTNISNVGSIVTSTTSEQGTSSKTQVFEYSESFDYVDFETVQDVTTGAHGESGPDY